MPGVATDNQARLLQKLNSIYFLNEICLACLFLKLVLYKKSITINVCFRSLELKLNTKEGTVNERTHLFIRFKFIKKN